jgi:hypothetical protein
MVGVGNLYAEQVACKRFVIVFDDNVKTLPQFVYSNGEKVGSVDRVQEQVSNQKQVPVCIENKYSGKFEKNTTCYVSTDQIVVYNFRPTGIGLKEGESVKGFVSRLRLYAYEAQEWFALMRSAATAFVFEFIEKFVGEDLAEKARMIYEVLAK